MGATEGMHGDWQHMTAMEAEHAEEATVDDNRASTGGVEASAAEETALAVGGEAAVELEATAPVDGPADTAVAP
jgi:hypothetical protein